MKVWLITWESWQETSTVMDNDRIAAILDGNLPVENVRQIVELLYANRYSILSERLNYICGAKRNPHPATIFPIEKIPGEYMINCGHEPHLEARRVEDCHVVGESSKEKLVWKRIEKSQ
jgi:hypothetical protein